MYSYSMALSLATKLLIGANMALPAACLCVCMHLERVASIRQVCTTKSDKRRRQIVEAILCFGLPIIWMAIREQFFFVFQLKYLIDDFSDYIVQGHRFDIIEEYGCRPATYVSVPAVFLIWVPPLALAATTCVFASKTVIRLSYAFETNDFESLSIASLPSSPGIFRDSSRIPFGSYIDSLPSPYAPCRCWNDIDSSIYFCSALVGHPCPPTMDKLGGRPLALFSYCYLSKSHPPSTNPDILLCIMVVYPSICFLIFRILFVWRRCH